MYLFIKSVCGLFEILVARITRFGDHVNSRILKQTVLFSLMFTSLTSYVWSYISL